jgi:23S rRNA pseudouridine1911/1915/1917 synthase
MIDLKNRILYEDDHILALDKPAGLVVHPDGRTKEDSVSEWFRSAYPESKGIGESMLLPDGETVIERPGVVHRIDRETSGALLLAKTHGGYDILKDQFMNREIEKVYHLFVYGFIKDEFGSIRFTIAKSDRDFRKWTADRFKKGEEREALTYYKVLKTTPKYSFVEAKPKTGRTHQIRVHFKAIHHPVVCDKLYAKKSPCLLGFDRLALHARSIKFTNVEGKVVQVEAPYPEDFKMAINKAGISIDK